MRGSVFTVVNYDIPTAAFGEISAQDDARERAAETMAQRFRAELALRMAQARDEGASRVKIKGASIRRFLDKPDKNVRAVLLYGPNESFTHEAAQKLAAWAMGKIRRSLRHDQARRKRDQERRREPADALAAQSLLGGPTIVWARITAKPRTRPSSMRWTPSNAATRRGYLIVEAGDIGSAAPSW